MTKSAPSRAASWWLGLPAWSRPTRCSRPRSPRCARARRTVRAPPGPPSTASRRASPKAGANGIPVAAAPDRRRARSTACKGTRSRPRLQVQEEGHATAHLPRRGHSGRKKKNGNVQRTSRVSSSSPRTGSNARHVLLAGVPASSARSGDSATASRRARSSGFKVGEPVRIGCSGWNYRELARAFYPQGLPARRWLEHYADAVRHRRGQQRPSTGCAKPSAVAAGCARRRRTSSSRSRRAAT